MTAAEALGERVLRLARDDRPLAHLELQQDVVYPHLSPGNRTHYIDRSLAIGREQAGEYRTPDSDLRKWALALGAKVEISDSPNFCAGIAMRSEYDAATRTITVYEPSIVEFGAALDALKCVPWPRERIVAVHIAHELFHHLEATRIVPVHLQLPAVVTGRIGPFPREMRARRCREIAAHAFARELLHLPFAPNAVDWLLLLARRPEHGESLGHCLDVAERAMGES